MDTSEEILFFAFSTQQRKSMISWSVLNFYNSSLLENIRAVGLNLRIEDQQIVYLVSNSIREISNS